MRFERNFSGSRHRRQRRGFTLVELLVAIIAGLLVAAAAISFSKQSTRFFSQEARIASAQMSVLTGFQRLQSDLSRASYMSTSNMRRDIDNNKVCAPNDAANWPDLLKTLTGLRITRGGSNTVPAPMPDGNYPDSVRVTGSMSSTEVFPVRTIQEDTSGTGHQVFLQVNTGAMTRSGFGEGADLTTVFQPGRIIRIVDQKRKHEYEVITSASFPVGGKPVVTTDGRLAHEGDGISACGFEGFGIGTQANVVNIIDYGIAEVSTHPVYKETVYSEAGYALGDETRTELIRREVLISDQDPPAIENDPAAEIVAEYAVDLRFGVWATNPGSGVTYLAPSTAAIDTRMALQANYAPGVRPSGPESVRSVEVRLAVRSREIDRRDNTDTTNPVLDGGFMFRYQIPGEAGLGFARVRTLLADVALPNQGGEAW